MKVLIDIEIVKSFHRQYACYSGFVRIAGVEFKFAMFFKVAIRKLDRINGIRKIQRLVDIIIRKNRTDITLTDRLYEFLYHVFMPIIQECEDQDVGAAKMLGWCECSHEICHELNAPEFSCNLKPLC